MPFYNEQTYYSPRGSYRLAYASPTLRLWYAGDTQISRISQILHFALFARASPSRPGARFARPWAISS